MGIELDGRISNHDRRQGIHLWGRSTAVTVVALIAVVLGAIPAWASDGDLDDGFSDLGTFVLDLGGYEVATDVAVAADGTIHVSGDQLTDTAFVMSLRPNGTPNGDFGSDGLVLLEFTGAELARATDIAVDPEGRVVVGGEVIEDDGKGGFMTTAWVTRLLADGSVDSAFFGGDPYLADFGVDEDFLAEVLVDELSRVVMVGSGNVSGGGMSTVPTGTAFRVDESGQTDASFGDNGRVTFANSGSASPLAATLDGDEVLVAGNTTEATLEIVRITSNGAIDSGFAVQIDDPRVSGAASLATTAAGRVVVIGGISDAVPNPLSLVVSRRLGDGFPDLSFGGVGLTEPESAVAVARGGDLDRLGRLIVVGRDSDENVAFISRVRYNGLIDQSFGTGGSRQFQLSAAVPSAVAITETGSAISVGSYEGITQRDIFVTVHEGSIPVVGFDDVSTFRAEIDAIARNGITLGCNPPENTRFCPDDPVTRGQMAAFLVRALGYVDTGGGDLFSDDDASVFEDDIDRLATAGVTLGCNPPENTRFCPDDPVTRGQMAAFLSRALGLPTDL